jgi:hypothetical protein
MRLMSSRNISSTSVFRAKKVERMINNKGYNLFILHYKKLFVCSLFNILFL